MTVFTGTLPEWLVEPVLAADLESMADALDALNDAWTTYVPVWTTSGTAPALGNGILLGWYQRVGHYVVMSITFIPGTTSTFGTGEFVFSAPVVSNSFDATGAAILLDSLTTRYSASCNISGGTSSVQVVAGSSNYVHATNPYTWAANDAIRLQVHYQA